MSSMYAPEPTATRTPAATKKRGRKRKSPERDEPAGDGHVNVSSRRAIASRVLGAHCSLLSLFFCAQLTEVYKPRSVPATPVEYKWKSSLVRLPTSRDSQVRAPAELHMRS